MESLTRLLKHLDGELKGRSTIVNVSILHNNLSHRPWKIQRDHITSVCQHRFFFTPSINLISCLFWVQSHLQTFISQAKLFRFSYKILLFLNKLTNFKIISQECSCYVQNCSKNSIWLSSIRKVEKCKNF